MEHQQEIQRALDAVDERIREKITLAELAAAAGFSPWYFSRVFRQAAGTPMMLYVTRRKLEFALYDLCRGRKVVDVAMEYGFETHAGFTKAFRRTFGCPPSLRRIHTDGRPLQRVVLSELRRKLTGGTFMHPQLIDLKPVTIVGYDNRYALPDVKHTHDIPAWWDSVNMEFSGMLSRLHHLFTESAHCEYGICYDADLDAGQFTYMLGVGVDNDRDLAKIEPDMRRMDLPGGLYAVFTTPLVPDEKYAESIRQTWKDILTVWLPDSGYEFDEARRDFEYYDRRDHAWEHDNMVQMDIYIPIRRR